MSDFEWPIKTAIDGTRDKGAPSVCCVCLTADRQELTERAVRCFREQTYTRKSMLIYDTGKVRFMSPLDCPSTIVVARELNDGTIGKLRNFANGLIKNADIIAHFDSDDWSHPNRLAEQVALLQSSGADCVGYREMLFWDSRKYVARVERDRIYHESREGLVNEAWLYTSQHAKPWALGTSFCYWRRTWEQKPFPDMPRNPGGSGEDTVWQIGLKVASVRSVGAPVVNQANDQDDEPRMIASIHGSNTAKYDLEELVARGCREWKRVPEWDARVREIMEAR